MRVPICQRHQIPYSTTTRQNWNGESNQLEINQQLLDYEPIISVKCYSLLPLYLCSQLAPKCNSSGWAIQPCRSVCKGINHMDTFEINSYINYSTESHDI